MRVLRNVIIITIVLMILMGCSQASQDSTTSDTPESTPLQETPTQQEEKKSVDEDMAEYQSLQNDVDAGRQEWRLDPVAVAKETVRGDSYTLISSDGVSKAVVEVVKGDQIIIVNLFKPVKQDKTGMWAVESFSEKE